MREAMKLLMASDMKTYELAEAVGYHDVRTFTDKFREVFGDSPSAYKSAEKYKELFRRGCIFNAGNVYKSSGSR